MTSDGGHIVIAIRSTTYGGCAVAPPVEAPPVAAETAEAGTTSEDVVNHHPALENENKVSTCTGRVCCVAARHSLALPVVLVLTSPTADMSSTSGLALLHRLNHCITLRALMRRRRIVARRVCILAAHAGEDGRLVMRLRRRWRRTRRHGGRGCSGDGSSGERGLGGRLPHLSGS